MKNWQQLFYTSFLVTGVLAVPVAAQTVNTETSSTSITPTQIGNDLDQASIVPLLTLSESAPTRESLTATPSKIAEVQIASDPRQTPLPQAQAANSITSSDKATATTQTLGAFRGNQAMSRFEFAAGLNSCLQQIEKLVAGVSSNFATRRDLETLQRLVNEFRPELTTIGKRVDTLESRTTRLEERQFSTTTKLFGQAIVGIQGRSENSFDFLPPTLVRMTIAATMPTFVITKPQLTLSKQLINLWDYQAAASLV